MQAYDDLNLTKSPELLEDENSVFFTLLRVKKIHILTGKSGVAICKSFFFMKVQYMYYSLLYL